jgi:hypothetical protein
MKNFTLTIALFLAFGLTFTSCKKEEAEETPTTPTTPPPTASTPGNPLPTPTDANGILASIKTWSVVSTPLGNQYLEIGVASAAFFNPSAPNTFLNAGNVSVEGTALTKQNNNAYVYTPGTTNPTGINFDNNIAWSVQGNADVDQLNTSHLTNIPQIQKINVNANQSISGSLTVGLDNTANNNLFTADSVIFTLVGPSKAIVKTVAANNPSYSFTASEISSLGKGSGFVQMAAYDMEKITMPSGKNYYLIAEGVQTVSVKFE